MKRSSPGVGLLLLLIASHYSPAEAQLDSGLESNSLSITENTPISLYCKVPAPEDGAQSTTLVTCTWTDPTGEVYK